MNFRALFLLTAFLLHAGMGLVGARPASGEGHGTGCTSGCCALMLDEAETLPCGCSMKEDPTPGESTPQPAAPVSSALRDLIPQVAWAMADSGNPVDLTAGFATGSPQRVAELERRQHGRLVPLTVLHCSFLH